MLRSFLNADGAKLVDEIGRFPDPGPISWYREYPCDDAGTVYRIAPIFPNIDAVVDWLKRLIELRRREQERQPKRLPHFLANRAALEYDEGPGLGVTHQYEGYAEYRSSPMPALLFRGESNHSRPSIPTLMRTVWPSMVCGEGEIETALEKLREQQQMSGRFTKKFFEEKALTKQF